MWVNGISRSGASSEAFELDLRERAFEVREALLRGQVRVAETLAAPLRDRMEGGVLQKAVSSSIPRRCVALQASGCEIPRDRVDWRCLDLDIAEIALGPSRIYRANHEVRCNTISGMLRMCAYSDQIG